MKFRLTRFYSATSPQAFALANLFPDIFFFQPVFCFLHVPSPRFALHKIYPYQIPLHAHGRNGINTDTDRGAEGGWYKEVLDASHTYSLSEVTDILLNFAVLFPSSPIAVIF